MSAPVSARDLRDAIAIGQLSAREVTAAALHRAHEADEALHCFLTIDDKRALATADELDRRRAHGEIPGPLWGVPFSVKDVYDTAGLRTTYGSRVYAEHVPDRDAVIVERIRQAGGVLIGKTNTPEFAIYIRTVNDLMPETLNPWDRERTTGGSSGGSAASVAAGVTPIAVGSDGGGSTRIPAALCGVLGLMPSRGAVPRTGGRIGTRRFSAAGPIAREAADATVMWNVIRGAHGSDALSRQNPPPLDRGPAGGRPRLRWVGDSGIAGAEADVVGATLVAARELADVVGGPLDESDAVMASARFSDSFYDIMQADRVSTGGGELIADPARAALLTTYGLHQFHRGSQVTGAAYSQALETQLAAVDHVESLLDDVDVVVTPTLAFVAPKIPTEGSQALPEDARQGFVAFTYLMNYTGHPALSVPCGTVRGLPVGLQLIGRPGNESFLLRLAGQFQAAHPMPAPVGTYATGLAEESA